MPTLTIEYRDESHRMALEQAIAYVSQLHQAAHDAPSGTVLEACEKLALSDGRRSAPRSPRRWRVGSPSASKGGAARPAPSAPRCSKGRHEAHGPDRRRPHHPETLLFLLPDLLAR